MIKKGKVKITKVIHRTINFSRAAFIGNSLPNISCNSLYLASFFQINFKII